MAGLSLITSHTSKAYAKQNCGNRGGVGVVKTIQHNDQPIVCSSGETRILSSTRDGNEIEINMDRGPVKAAGAAVTVTGQGTNITILKKITVINGSGSGLPVIKVLSGGKLTLDQEVNVTGVTEMQKVIVVDGGNSSVMLNGKLTGFEGVQVKNGGMVVLGEGVKTITGTGSGSGVVIDGGGTVRFDESVTFNNVTEAGIKIKGSGMGKATVMGNLKTMTVTKGSRGDGVGIQMDGTGGTASVVMLKIKGEGSGGMGVDVQNGTMTLTGVEISEFRVGVHAQNGTVKLMGESKITVEANGTGIMVGRTGNASMMGGSIKGGGSGQGTGVQGSGTVTLNMVDVSGVKVGVDMQGGTLEMNKGSINFTGERGSYGVRASGGATAELTKVTITGKGSGQGVGVIKDGAGTMTMTEVGISGVKVGVHAKSGTLNMMGGTVTFESGSGNWGVKVESGVMANIMGATIKGSGSGKGMGLYVVGGTATMNGGTISNVESGVYATGTGNLTINGGAKITFTRDYGVKVMGAANANITGATITGGGATGTGVIKDGT
ncbi:hypothetical protein, partial [Bartonella bovis]|uniref:hypothetical protein n=1 Tax=Bartonella bovis TaxID=155194 RepID=UPI0011AF3B52